MAIEKNLIYLGLGSNLGDKNETLNNASLSIESHIGEIQAKSGRYLTEALNPPDLTEEGQPDYLNEVILVQSSLDPFQTLEKIHLIEKSFGRDRNPNLKWRPRSLDIDILLFNDLVLETPHLSIPHPGMHIRDFVLRPLYDIAPNFRHPVLNRSVETLLKNLVGSGERQFVKCLLS